MRRIIPVIAVLAVVLLAGTVYGQGFMMHQRIAKALELTDEQKSAIQDLAFRTKRASIEVKAKLQIARLDLAQLMSANTPDAKAIESRIAEIGRLQTRLMKNRIDFFLSVRKLLTPEQLKKARSLGLWRLFLRKGRPFKPPFPPEGKPCHPMPVPPEK